MRILYVVGSMDPAAGGISQFIRNSIPEITASGSICEVVSLDSPSASFLITYDFPIYALGPTKGPLQYAAKLKPWLKANANRFDVIIVNGLWIYTSYATWKIISKQQSPTVRLFVMPHGMLDPYFQKAADRKLKAVRNWLYWKLIESKVVNNADGLLFTCQTELELARDSFHSYQPKKEINVGFGIVPPPIFATAMQAAFLEKCPEVTDKLYLLFFGRIHNKKGVDILINAYAAIAQQAVKEEKTIPALVIAGPGLDTAFGEKMIQLAKTHTQLDGLIFFPGMLTGNAKWGAIYGCEAFVLPSHQENFGIAVVEAMACKKAVIITDKINIWKEINDTGSAIVNTDTVEGTQASLTEWLNLSHEEQQKMGERASAGFTAYFHIKPATITLLNALSVV